FRELLEQLPLFARRFPRRLHLHGREEIAPTAAADVGHPLAAKPQRGAGLRPFRHFDVLGAVESRHLDLAAERDGRKVDRDLAEQIVAVAPEELVLLHVDDDVEVAGRTAAGARFAFALQPQLLAGGNTRRNLHGDLPVVCDAPRSSAGLTRLRDHAAGAAALRTSLCDGEETLLTANLPLALAQGTGRR